MVAEGTCVLYTGEVSSESANICRLFTEESVMP